MICVNKIKIKNVTLDLLADIVGSFLLAIGIYNFATASEFPVTGISGIAQVLYYYFEVGKNIIDFEFFH